MNKKILFLVTAGCVVSIAGTLIASSVAPSAYGAASVCEGNHYTSINEDFDEVGVKEYWVCCKHHEIYTSIDQMSFYGKEYWTDAGQATQDVFNTVKAAGSSDTRFIGKALDSTVALSGCGFTADSSTGVISNNGGQGYLLTEKSYDDVSFTVNVSQASSHNPYNEHALQNSIIVGANATTSKIVSGWAIDICADFIDVFYFYDGRPTDNNAGNAVVWKEGNYSNKDLTVSIKNKKLIVKDGDTELINKLLIVEDYWNMQAGTNHHIGVISYDAGQIGFWSRTGSSATMTLSNLSYGSKALTFTEKSEGNDWSTSSNPTTINSTKTKGWVLSDESYTDFSFTIQNNGVADENAYSTKNLWNSFLFGNSKNGSRLNGFALEMHKEYVMVHKFSTTSSDPVNKSSGCIGGDHYFPRSGTFNTVNKPIHVVVLGTEIYFFCKGSSDYLEKGYYGKYSISGYDGGKIGFLDYMDSTGHTLTIK